MTLKDKQLRWVGDQVLAVTLIKRDVLAGENLLMMSKWSGYRFLTPLAATKLFAEEYAKAYKDCLRKNVDVTVALNSKAGMNMDFSKPNRQATQMWLARQEADMDGLPYPDYLEFCFNFATRRQRHQLPQPNQLRGNHAKARVWFVEGLKEFWDPAPDRRGRQRDPRVDLGQAEAHRNSHPTAFCHGQK